MRFRSQKGQTTIILLAVVFVLAFLLIGGLGDPTHHTILSPDDPNQIRAQQENGGLFGKFENMLGLGGGDIPVRTLTPTPTPPLIPGGTIVPSPTPTGTTEYPPRPIKFFWDEPTGTYTNPQLITPSKSKNGMQMNALKFDEVTPPPPPVTSAPTTTPPPVVVAPPPVSTPPPAQNEPGQSCIHEQLITNGCICGTTSKGYAGYNVTCQGGKIVGQQYDPNSVSPKWCVPKPDGNYCVGKPVIYLYPTVPTLVNVKLIIPGAIVESDPFYPFNIGWKNVLAYPDGTLSYQGNSYTELYYESSIASIHAPKSGIVIPRQQLQTELSSIVTRLGLISKERDEFLSYWMPKLTALNSPYIFFSILDLQEKERIDHVEISPQPNTFIGFIAYFKPLSHNETVVPLKIPQVPPKRIGFTAVEWGGTIE